MNKKVDRKLISRARKILREVPLIDGHNDIPWQFRKRANNNLELIDFADDTSRLNPPMRTDIPRLRAGCVGAQFWAVYLPPTLTGSELVNATLEQIELIHHLVRRYSEVLELALCATDIERIHSKGKIASLIGIEGGYIINNSTDMLKLLYDKGVRYLTLTCSHNTEWADSATDTPRHNGLTQFGRKVIKEMNRFGMIVDLSHCSEQTIHDALDVSEAPVIFSHSATRALVPHPRNVSDEVLKRISSRSDVVMIPFVPYFVSDKVHTHFLEAEEERARLFAKYPENQARVEEEMKQWLIKHPLPQATITDVANHIDYVREVAGIDHVGIGSDFDGFIGTTKGIEDVSCYPALIAELLRRGYTRTEVKKVAGLNFLRVFREVETIAKQIQHREP